MKNRKYHIQQCPHCKTRSNDFLSIITQNTSSLLLHDSKSIHYQVHCEVCGASGPWGRTEEESLTLWEYVRKINYQPEDDLQVA
jgi:hypothetical protein